MIKLYNTLTRKKEVFKEIYPGKVRMYSCGPTVYDTAHIGNLRAYIFADILHRTLLFNDYKVLFVENITDVGHLTGDRDMGEDKMDLASKRSGETAWEIAKKYEKKYWEDCSLLNIIKPNIISRATEHIQEQIEMVRELETKGFTYKTNDGIYFDTSKLEDYGKLALLNKEGLKEGARIEINPDKKNETDFALWKFSPKDKKRQMEWESPWGIGFPGWHIECSAMSIKYLGEPFDIHTGGIDHIPVHHTNEIAQNEALYGHKTVNYWIHSAHIIVDGKKMSKSLGNAYQLNDLIKRNLDPLLFRYFVISASYRQTINFTWQAIENSKKSYDALINKIAAIKKSATKIDNKYSDEYISKFTDSINNDLNTSGALSFLQELLKDEKIVPEEKIATIEKMDSVLGLSLIKNTDDVLALKVDIPVEVLNIVKERDIARKNKDWAMSDNLRNKIKDLGYEIKDTENGPEIKKINTR